MAAVGRVHERVGASAAYHPCQPLHRAGGRRGWQRRTEPAGQARSPPGHTGSTGRRCRPPAVAVPQARRPFARRNPRPRPQPPAAAPAASRRGWCACVPRGGGRWSRRWLRRRCTPTAWGCHAPRCPRHARAPPPSPRPVCSCSAAARHRGPGPPPPARAAGCPSSSRVGRCLPAGDNSGRWWRATTSGCILARIAWYHSRSFSDCSDIKAVGRRQAHHSNVTPTVGHRSIKCVALQFNMAFMHVERHGECLESQRPR